MKSGNTDSGGSDDTNRLEAFSDGVFAVAITLLVPNIQVPHLKDLQPPTTLVDALLKQWPSYLGYVISFFTIGIVWANHHRTFTLVVHADYSLLMLNVFLLMTVTLIPFTTALLSEYIEQPDQQRTAAFIYSSGWLLLAIAYNLLWKYAVSRAHVDPTLTPSMLNSIGRRTLTGLLFYIIAVIVAFFSAIASVLICLALAIYYLIPVETLPERLR